FERYGRRLVPVHNYFQAALILLEDGLLDASAAIGVAIEMVDQFDYSLDALRNSLEDLLRRGRVARDTVRIRALRLGEGGPMPGPLPSSRAILDSFATRVRELKLPEATEGSREAGAIDYLAAFDDDVPRKRSSRVNNST